MNEPHPIQTPIVLALVVCDAIWKDPSTGKKTILGTFPEIETSTFPSIKDHFGIYAAMTDGRGFTPVRVVFTDIDEQEEPLLDRRIDIRFDEPREVVELLFNEGPIAFPRPGDYRLQLWAAGELLMERRIEAHWPRGT